MDYNYNKFKNFKYIDSIFRKRKSSIDRVGKFRFDRQERISPFPKVFINKILSKFKSEHITCYPEIDELYEIYSKELNLKKENILLTAGSDLAIKTCYELIVRKKDEIITIFPTYGMTNVYANLFEAKERKVFFQKNLSLNIDKLISLINKKTKLIIFANPNSPTGTIIPEDKIEIILKKARDCNSFVLIDECYYGFYPKTVIKKIKKYKNLIVSRSFSKAIGLAGCRIGALISNNDVIRKLSKYRPMHEISHFSAFIAKLILKNKNIYKNYLKETIKGKKYFENFLDKNQLSYYESFANFLLVDFKNKKRMNKILNAAQKKGILIHGEPYIPGCQNYIKFTTGPIKYMKIIEKLIIKNLN